MLRNEGDRLRTVVVCRPGAAYLGVRDLERHNLEERADPARTVKQHRELVRLLKEHDVWVWDVPERPGHPNATFTRDMAVVTPEGAIRLRMGLASRAGEPTWIGEALEAFGEPTVGEIEAPGTIEGGDVILAGDVAFVGRSERTNQSGIDQLGAFLEPMGYALRTVDVEDPFLHVGSMMSVIGPRRVVACADAIEACHLEGFDVVEVPSPSDMPPEANVICLAPDEVIADTSGDPGVIHALEGAGVTVHGLDLSEFRKGAGGPTCVILPVERG